MSTLGTTRAHRLSVSLPYSGAWRADVILENGTAAPTGKQTLTVGDLALTGTALRGDLDAPGKPHVVLVGGIGWEKAAGGALSYEAPAGGTVRLSSVLQDLATRSGEPIEQPADANLGRLWSLDATSTVEPLRLRDALSTLTREGYVGAWRVDPDGVTRFGPRIGTAIKARATVLRRDASVGVKVEGIDSPAAFLPGNTLDGAVILRTVINEVPGNIVAEVWTEPNSIRTQIARMMAERFPQLVYGYPRTYKVAGVRADKTLDLLPPSFSPHLAPLAAVEQWLPGRVRVTPKVGSLCVVVFRDANRGRPAVVGFDPASTPDALAADADVINLGAAAGAVVRHGDTVLITPGNGAGNVTGFITVTSGTAQFPPAVSKVKA